MEDIKFAIKMFVFMTTVTIVVPGISVYIMAKEMLRPKTTEEIIREAIKFKRDCPKYASPQSKDLSESEIVELIERLK